MAILRLGKDFLEGNLVLVASWVCFWEWVGFGFGKVIFFVKFVNFEALLSFAGQIKVQLLLQLILNI